MHILDKIVAHKKLEIAEKKRLKSIRQLEASPFFNKATNSLVKRLGNDEESGFIAEFKRMSPSKKDINKDADLIEVINGYQKGGASAISILTDKTFFGGDDNYLINAKSQGLKIPLLRKEFILDEYQVVESKAIGADIILLICEILTGEQIKHLTALARSLEMEVLLELHSAQQLPKCDPDVSMIGVNNRDLTTFEVDYERSKKLYDQLPAELPKIAESGLKDISTLLMLSDYGFDGFLIGEQFMKQKDPGLACQKMIAAFSQKNGKKHIVN